MKARDSQFWRDAKKRFKMFLDMFIVQHIQVKIMFNFQPTESLVITTVENAKLAVKCSIFHLQNENLQWKYLMEMVHIVMPERRVVTTKKKNFLHFGRNFTANVKQALKNLCQKQDKNTFYL